jgi:D-alanyl-D-alanine carboxypeptidase
MTGCGGRDSGSARPVPSQSLQRILDKARSDAGGVAISAAIVERGRLRWSGGSGSGDLRRRARVSGATPFELGSVTKTFIATLVLRLSQDGVLRLDDPVVRWLPGTGLPAEITIRRLLNHTSGLFGVDEDPAYRRSVEGARHRRWTPQRTLRYVRRRYFAPGKGWHYSDTNYVLAGLAIERATAAPVAANLRTLVLAPLGIENAGLQPQDRPPVGTPRGYGDPQMSGTIRDLSRGMRWIPYDSLASTEWSAGGMFASAEGVAIFGDALFRGNIVRPAAIREMVDFVPAAFGDYIGYGLGVGKRFFSDLGGEVWGSVGRVEGFFADLWHVPSRGVTVTVLANDIRIDTTEVADTLLRRILPRR